MNNMTQKIKKLKCYDEVCPTITENCSTFVKVCLTTNESFRNSLTISIVSHFLYEQNAK